MKENQHAASSLSKSVSRGEISMYEFHEEKILNATSYMYKNQHATS